MASQTDRIHRRKCPGCWKMMMKANYKRHLEICKLAIQKKVSA